MHDDVLDIGSAEPEHADPEPPPRGAARHRREPPVAFPYSDDDLTLNTAMMRGTFFE